ncbi:hypothetical protein ACJX0J_027612, partial [Zea mays]
LKLHEYETTQVFNYLKQFEQVNLKQHRHPLSSHLLKQHRNESETQKQIGTLGLIGVSVLKHQNHINRLNIHFCYHHWHKCTKSGIHESLPRELVIVDYNIIDPRHIVLYGPIELATQVSNFKKVEHRKVEVEVVFKTQLSTNEMANLLSIQRDILNNMKHIFTITSKYKNYDEKNYLVNQYKLVIYASKGSS